MQIVWSGTALRKAGAGRREIESEIRAEALQVAAEAEDMFDFVVWPGEEGPCYNCVGIESGDAWQVAVRSATMLTIMTFPEDHPVMSLRGKPCLGPVADEDPDNEVFYLVSDDHDADRACG